MTDERGGSQGQRPRAEPEIFAPGEPMRPSRTDPYGESIFVHRIHLTRLGPFGLAMLALAIGLVAVVLLLLVVGAVLFWLPIVALLVAIPIFSSAIRSRWRQG